jgi:acyl-CoA synthetase (AMP-forming)/AMP-acid ligase II
MVARWRGCADTAIAMTTTAWSGDELLARAAGAAGILRTVTGPDPPEVAVPALLEASPETFALLIAGSATGRPLAPVSPRATAHELRSCLTALVSPVLLAQPAWLELAREATQGTGIRVEVIEDVDRGPSDDLDLDPAPDSIAFVSGMTSVASRSRAGSGSTVQWSGSGCWEESARAGRCAR